MNGNEDDYNFVLDKYFKTTFAPEQQILLHALASTPTPYLQQRTLQLALSDKVRLQDVLSVIQNVAILTPVGRILSLTVDVSVWLFFMSNWKDLTQDQKFGAFGKVTGLLQTVVSKFSNSYLISEAERLFVKKLDPDFYIPPHADIAVLKVWLF
jgi:aminopeptidase 2